MRQDSLDIGRHDFPARTYDNPPWTATGRPCCPVWLSCYWYSSFWPKSFDPRGHGFPMSTLVVCCEIWAMACRDGLPVDATDETPFCMIYISSGALTIMSASWNIVEP